MKAKINDEELNLVSLAKKYSNENRARKLFEQLRWPGGKPVCPHCQNNGDAKTISKLTAKAGSHSSVRKGVYFCGACRKPFSATVGTVFEDSHVPLSKILMAIFIICSSKKSVSAMQLKRMLRTTYRTAWFLAHRCRHAMATDFKTAKPLDNVCEADETFMPNFEKPGRKTCVALIVERNGEARTQVIASVTAKNIGDFLGKSTRKTATVNTDEHAAYKIALKGYKRHDRVCHSRYEYARHNSDGTVAHVNTCESFFSLLKRGVFGAWHCISAEHLQKYSDEFSFRWNTRKHTDGERIVAFMPLIAGKRLMYRQPAN